MRSPSDGGKAVLFCGMISSDASLMDKAAGALEADFGPIAEVSEPYDFDHTDYYADESGPDLVRRFIAFETAIAQDRLVAIKLGAIELEKRLAEESSSPYPRPINLDPGLLRMGSIVLASTKASDHRICLGEGIHAELTMVYEAGGWKPLPWTFPDFRSGMYDTFFQSVRDRLKSLRRPVGE